MLLALFSARCNHFVTMRDRRDSMTIEVDDERLAVLGGEQVRAQVRVALRHLGPCAPSSWRASRSAFLPVPTGWRTREGGPGRFIPRDLRQLATSKGGREVALHGCSWM